MDQDQQWPPKPYDAAFARFNVFDAWWRGDTDELQKIYAGQTATHVHNGVPHSGGLVGNIKRAFWGDPVPTGESRMRMHLPVAADLCELSSDLLFGKPPAFNLPPIEQQVDGKTVIQAHPQQERLDEIMGSEETHAELLKGGELAAAHGGVYFAAAWDTELESHVWLRAFAADTAIPEYRHGRLSAVTLWTQYAVDRKVYRLFERHAPGTIRYELREGTEKAIGPAVPLATIPETAHYEALRGADEYEAVEKGLTNQLAPHVVVSTGIDVLDVVYMPNRLPNREWRKSGDLAHLGRSDLDGVEDILDKIDKTWSSLMRDLDLGAARIIVPESMVEVGDRGAGASFDTGREIFLTLNTVGRADSDEMVKTNQFEIRVEEHLRIIDGLRRELAEATGYSPAHLGLKPEGAQKTATEVVADFSDSERTRDKKAIHAKPALAKMAQILLGIDAKVFPKGGAAWLEERPEVEFAPVSQHDPEKAARTLLLLHQAEAVSLRQRIRDARPSWSAQQVEEEVAEILADLERGSVVDPAIGTGWTPTGTANRSADTAEDDTE